MDPSGLSRSRTAAGTVDPSGSLLSPPGGDLHDHSQRSFVTAKSRISARSILEPINIPLDSTIYPGVPDKVPLSHHISPQNRQRSQNMGLCVLCIHGGGVRGMIPMLTLYRVLRLIQPEGKIYPYRYFDIICGTSTGGLIAILLGILHLDLDTAISLYRELSRAIFNKGYSWMRLIFKDAGFARTPLESAIIQILRNYGEGRTLMEDSVRDRGCRTFVTTTHCADQQRDVQLVRSYRTPGEQAIPHGYSWTIADAALATSAAPSYFERHHIKTGGVRFRFEDAGAHPTNNPTRVALEECRKLRDAENSMFLSLGTGSSAGSEPSTGILGMFKNKIDTVEPLERYLTDVDDVDEWMKKEAGISKIRYHRISPPLQGSIGLADWERLPAMEAASARHYQKKRDKFRRIADEIRLFQE